MLLTEEDRSFVKNYDPGAYERPSVTADTALFRVRPLEKAQTHFAGHQLEVLLVRRKKPPYQGGWALPGGFCDMDETLAQAAERELIEETGLSGLYYGQVGTFDAVNRDPRTRVIGTLFLAIAAYGMADAPQAADDAAEARWFKVEMRTEPLEENRYRVRLALTSEEILLRGTVFLEREANGVWHRKAEEETNGLAFDHLELIAAAVETLRHKLYLTDLPYRWLPKVFELGTLQSVFEAVIGEPLLRTTFFEHVKARLQRVDSAAASATLEQRYSHREAFTPPEGSVHIDLWRS